MTVKSMASLALKHEDGYPCKNCKENKWREVNRLRFINGYVAQPVKVLPVKI